MSALKENRAKYIEVKGDDLPLHCPMPDMVKWNQHPRVFLAIDRSENGEVQCPYCGTRYKLVGPVKKHH
ncbi:MULTISPECIES: zinc-finger domain-containing protein [Aquaspirillum]|jgi:uncharacterized Zn-finger protein|uniref:zinc-finger domain-containing protein n=1 Tax=Aquaspirillum serpens TaxID=190 RepID=UPI0003B4BEB1|nr:zinc-finger domain-containing protein [Aquaspirillum serpens]MBP7970656.1 zinc-finger domain-containing protein [Aquaspirillum sp.]